MYNNEIISRNYRTTRQKQGIKHVSRPTLDPTTVSALITKPHKAIKSCQLRDKVDDSTVNQDLRVHKNIRGTGYLPLYNVQSVASKNIEIVYSAGPSP